MVPLAGQAFVPCLLPPAVARRLKPKPARLPENPSPGFVGAPAAAGCSQFEIASKYEDYASVRLGSALRVVFAIMPARNREYAAAAIIAALSVESARLGKNTWIPALFPRSSNVARSWLFAATPPDTKTLSAARSLAALMVRSTRSRTTAF